VKNWFDEREGIDWKRLRLPLRQKARTCTQNKYRSAIHAVSRFEHSSLVRETQGGQRQQGPFATMPASSSRASS